MTEERQDFRRGIAVPYLRKWRDARALTQKELARRARVAVSTVQNAEAGRRIHATKVARLAKALQVDRTTLLLHTPQQQ
jgi:transcriptional regulator with XRE-family HTH domain